jgi:hypothetical protein
MGYVVLGSELSVDLVNAAGAVIQQNVRVAQGRRLPDNVSPFLINALKGSGLIAFAADSPIPDPIVREVEPPAQVRTPDQPPVLPSDPVGNRVVSGEVEPDEAQPQTATVFAGGPVGGNMDPKDTIGAAAGFATADEGEQVPAEKPKASDNKEAWENYAVSQGVDRAEAESMTKKDLMAEVERREAQQD